MNARRSAAPAARPADSGAVVDPAASPALDWAVSHGAVDQVFARVGAKLRRRRRHRLGAAAGALCALGAVILGWQAPPLAFERAAVAAVARTPSVTSPPTEILPDGTVVELREGARITVAFTEAVRRVNLELGAAHFQVTKNPQRPFVVTAGGVDVRAVGTAFAVQLGTGAVEVLVTEGRVAVEKPAHPAAQPDTPAVHHYANVEAGSRVVVETGRPPTSTPIVAVSPSEMTSRLAWRVPRLELAGTSLERTLVLLNQHSAVPLRLAEPELGRLELSGVIRADNADSLLRLLRVEFGIEAEYRDTEIVLRRRR